MTPVPVVTTILGKAVSGSISCASSSAVAIHSINKTANNCF